MLENLNEYKLRHQDVRKVILQRFLYQSPDARPIHKSPGPRLIYNTKAGNWEHEGPEMAWGPNIDNVIDKGDSRNIQQAVQESKTDANSLFVAVRRSRTRDRLQSTTKDTMLYDGCEWGFFKNDLDIEVLSTNRETIKANVEVSWKKTMKAQGDDDHGETWEKPLRYALAILMAKFGSLDSSKQPEALQRVAPKRLILCVTPCGLLSESRDYYTQLPNSLPVAGNQRGS